MSLISQYQTSPARVGELAFNDNPGLETEATVMGDGSKS